MVSGQNCQFPRLRKCKTRPANSNAQPGGPGDTLEATSEILYILPVGTWSWFLATFSSLQYYKLNATSIHPYEHDKLAPFTKKI
jgi:hypothetical protein